ncbi:hypothetical protein K1W54_41670, partial [Micromonospora sp. CPCC 205371]|nr:hypothetical protein [Micromonospora sp. CPCC 205371]
MGNAQLDFASMDRLLGALGDFPVLGEFRQMAPAQRLVALDALRETLWLAGFDRPVLLERVRFLEELRNFQHLMDAADVSGEDRLRFLAEPALLAALQPYAHLTPAEMESLSKELGRFQLMNDHQRVVLLERFEEWEERHAVIEVPVRTFTLHKQTVRVGVLADHSESLRAGAVVPVGHNTFLITFSGRVTPDEVEKHGWYAAGEPGSPPPDTEIDRIVAAELARIDDQVKLQFEALGPRLLDAMAKTAGPAVYSGLRALVETGDPGKSAIAAAAAVFALAHAQTARMQERWKAAVRSSADLRAETPGEERRADVERALADATAATDALRELLLHRMARMADDSAATPEQREFRRIAEARLSYSDAQMDKLIADLFENQLEFAGQKHTRLSRNVYAYTPADEDGKPRRGIDPVVVVVTHDRIDEVRIIRQESYGYGDLHVIVPDRMTIGYLGVDASRAAVVEQVRDKLAKELDLYGDRPEGRAGLKAYLRRSLMANGATAATMATFAGANPMAQYTTEAAVIRMAAAGFVDQFVENTNGVRLYQLMQFTNRYGWPALHDQAEMTDRITHLAEYHDELTRLLEEAERVRYAQPSPGLPLPALPGIGTRAGGTGAADREAAREEFGEHAKAVAGELSTMFSKAAFDARTSRLTLTLPAGGKVVVEVDARELPDGMGAVFDPTPPELNRRDGSAGASVIDTHRATVDVRTAQGLAARRVLGQVLATVYAHQVGADADRMRRIADLTVLAGAARAGSPVVVLSLGEAIDRYGYRHGRDGADVRWLVDSGRIPEGVRDLLAAARRDAVPVSPGAPGARGRNALTRTVDTDTARARAAEVAAALPELFPDSGWDPDTGTLRLALPGGREVAVVIDTAALPDGEAALVEIAPDDLNGAGGPPTTHRITVPDRTGTLVRLRRALAQALGVVHGREVGMGWERSRPVADLPQPRVADLTALARAAAVPGPPALFRHLARAVTEYGYGAGEAGDAAWAGHAGRYPPDVRAVIDRARQAVYARENAAGRFTREGREEPFDDAHIGERLRSIPVTVFGGEAASLEVAEDDLSSTVALPDGTVLHFRHRATEPARLPDRVVATIRQGSGTAADPYLLEVSSRAPDAAVDRAAPHEIGHAVAPDVSHGADPERYPREVELRVIQHRIGEAVAAGDESEVEALVADGRALRDEMGLGPTDAPDWLAPDLRGILRGLDPPTRAWARPEAAGGGRTVAGERRAAEQARR